MVREAAGDLLPFSHIGGIALGARATILHGVPAPLAFASTIVDVTTELLAQIAFIALGLGVLSRHAPSTAFSASLGKFVLIGLAMAIFAGAAFSPCNAMVTASPHGSRPHPAAGSRTHGRRGRGPRCDSR